MNEQFRNNNNSTSEKLKLKLYFVRSFVQDEDSSQSNDESILNDTYAISFFNLFLRLIKVVFT